MIIGISMHGKKIIMIRMNNTNYETPVTITGVSFGIRTVGWFLPS